MLTEQPQVAGLRDRVGGRLGHLVLGDLADRLIDEFAQRIGVVARGVQQLLVLDLKRGELLRERGLVPFGQFGGSVVRDRVGGRLAASEV